MLLGSTKWAGTGLQPDSASNRRKISLLEKCQEGPSREGASSYLRDLTPDEWALRITDSF